MAVVTVLVLLPTPSRANPAQWRDGWCAEGEGVSVVVDWNHAPDAPATITQGQVPHIVRCVPVTDSSGSNLRVRLLDLAGIPRQGSDSYVTAVNGISEELPDTSWHIRVGSQTVWTDSYEPELGTHDAVSFTYWDATISPESPPYPVLSPQYAPPTHSPEPTEPTETTDPTDSPGATQTPSATGTPTTTASPAPSQTPVNSDTPQASDTPVPTEAASSTQPTPTTDRPSATTPSPTASAPLTDEPSRTHSPSVTTTAAPTPTPTTPVPEPDEVWVAEPVRRVEQAPTAPAGASWAAVLVGGVFTALTAGGAALLRQLGRSRNHGQQGWSE